MNSTTCTTTTSSAMPVTEANAGTITVGPSNISYKIPSFEGRCLDHTNGVPTEIIQIIFMHCLGNSDGAGFVAFGSTNVHCRTTMQDLVIKRLLEGELCPNLTIQDPTTCEEISMITSLKKVEITLFQKLEIFRCYHQVAPHIEGNAGCTLYYKCENITLNQILADAKNAGTKAVIYWDQIIPELGNVVIEDSGLIMASNAPVTETRKNMLEQRTGSPEEQEKRVCIVGFEGKQRLEDTILVIACAQKTSNLQICLFGKKPLTYNRTSTYVDGIPLAVGGSAPGRLYVDSGCYDYEISGAGGRRKFSAIGPWTIGVRKIWFLEILAGEETKACL